MAATKPILDAAGRKQFKNADIPKAMPKTLFAGNLAAR